MNARSHVAAADAALVAMGQRFDELFEAYLRKASQARAVAHECEQRLETFGVPIGSERWQRLRSICCGSSAQSMNEAGAELEALSRDIRAMPAATLDGILAKARCLPFDMAKIAVSGVPLDEQDCDVETLYSFIDEIERLTYGRASC